MGPIFLWDRKFTQICYIYADTIFRGVPQNCKKGLLASCLSICSSVCMEQLDSHCKDFRSVLYLRISRKIWRQNLSCIKI